MTIEDIAEIAYDMNRKLVGQDGMGDDIEIKLPEEWSRTSDAYKSLSYICIKAILGYSYDVLPIQWHPAFVRDLKAAGWTYGARGDINKTHPYITDWENLSIAQKQRLYIYGIVTGYYRRQLEEKE